MRPPLSAGSASPIIGMTGMDEQLLAQILANPKLTPATLATHLDPNWIAAPHLKFISLKLAMALNAGNARIILSVPPRHGKSRISSIGTSVWALEKWPKKSIILTSYGADLSTEFSSIVRDQIAQNPDKLSVRLSADTNRVDRFKTTQGGGLVAVGTGGAITGRGADILIIDDFIKEIKDALSFVSREYVWNWFSTTAMTRLQPGGSVIIVATRWHEDDLIGRILERFPGVWDYIKLPAIAEKDDPLGRNIGAALWPEWYGLPHLNQWKTLLGTTFFNSIYQQDPRSTETKLANREWVQITPILPNPSHLRWVRVWDLAATEGGGDYTTGGLHALDVFSRDMITAHMIRRQLSPSNVEKIVKETADLDGFGVPIVIEQEPGSAGVSLLDHYKNNVLKGFTVIGIPTTKAKAVRAQPMLAGAEFNRYWLLKGAWNEIFLKEFDLFPNAEHDDQVDNSAIAWNFLVGKEAPGATWGRKSQDAADEKERLARQLADPIANLGLPIDPIKEATGLTEAEIERLPEDHPAVDYLRRRKPRQIKGENKPGVIIRGATWGTRHASTPKRKIIEVDANGKPVNRGDRPLGQGLIFKS